MTTTTPAPAAAATRWQRLAARAKVIAKAAPTWLAVGSAAAPEMAHVIAEQFPHGAEGVTRVVLTAGSVLAGAVATIRVVQLVAKEERGLLKSPIPTTPKEA